MSKKTKKILIFIVSLVVVLAVIMGVYLIVTKDKGKTYNTETKPEVQNEQEQDEDKTPEDKSETEASEENPSVPDNAEPYENDSTEFNEQFEPEDKLGDAEVGGEGYVPQESIDYSMTPPEGYNVYEQGNVIRYESSDKSSFITVETRLGISGEDIAPSYIGDVIDYDSIEMMGQLPMGNTEYTAETVYSSNADKCCDGYFIDIEGGVVCIVISYNNGDTAAKDEMIKALDSFYIGAE